MIEAGGPYETGPFPPTRIKCFGPTKATLSPFGCFEATLVLVDYGHEVNCASRAWEVTSACARSG